ncbi:MAG: hypothetical protein LBB25_03190 [Holosporaceae bacterium]|jgi:hypothetical protein|nr:hypothetical protein [Holosporaceae bacterium]
MKKVLPLVFFLLLSLGHANALFSKKPKDQNAAVVQRWTTLSKQISEASAKASTRFDTSSKANFLQVDVTHLLMLRLVMKLLSEFGIWCNLVFAALVNETDAMKAAVAADEKASDKQRTKTQEQMAKNQELGARIAGTTSRELWLIARALIDTLVLCIQFLRSSGTDLNETTAASIKKTIAPIQPLAGAISSDMRLFQQALRGFVEFWENYDVTMAALAQLLTEIGNIFAAVLVVLEFYDRLYLPDNADRVLQALARPDRGQGRNGSTTEKNRSESDSYEKEEPASSGSSGTPSQKPNSNSRKPRRR